MKSKNKYINMLNIQRFTLVVCLFIFQTSCKKFVDIPPPTTQLVTASVFNDNSTATAAQLGIYAQMSGLPFSMERYSGISSDELFPYSTEQGSLDAYKNSLVVQDATTVGFWTGGYNIIYEANAIIEGLQKTTGVVNSVKQQLTGEAKFTRAFWHFNLVNFYGDIPIVTTTDYTRNSSLSRAPQKQVYQQIITDLIDAQNLLSKNYLDGTSLTITTDRVRPTYWAATALLARVYLYYGNLTNDITQYTNAMAQATTVINNTSAFSLPTDLTQVFKKNSSETIWAIMPAGATTYYTSEGTFFILTAAPSTSGFTVSNQLLNAFEPGDNRSGNWIGSITVSGKTYYFPYKYRDNNTSASLKEYTMILRLAEQYLIRAEAEANEEGNGLASAINDLNIIRHRAGLTNYTGSPTDKSQILAAIMHERQVELFTEGHRWFDLKRAGIVGAVMGVVTPQKGGNQWNTNQQLYPIPLGDINGGINLTQNPGY